MVWNDYDTIEPLAGIPTDYCRHSAHANWTWTLSFDDVRKRLEAKGHRLGTIRDVQFKDRNGDGHYDWVTVVGSRRKLEMLGNDFRVHYMGSTRLKSMYFTAERRGNAYVLTGHGFGHGVGMCQHGANGMALQGKTYDQIVRHFYPGATLTKIY
jgi:stage II sporulation protein D